MSVVGFFDLLQQWNVFLDQVTSRMKWSISTFTVRYYTSIASTAVPLSWCCFTSTISVIKESSAKLALTARAQHLAVLGLAELVIKHPIVSVSCAKLSSPHYVLCVFLNQSFSTLHQSALLYREYSMFGQVEVYVTGRFNTDFVHFSFKPTSYSDYGPKSLKRPLCPSVCFHFCLVFMV